MGRLQILSQTANLHLPPPEFTNMTMENPPFEDVFPIEKGNFPMSC